MNSELIFAIAVSLICISLGLYVLNQDYKSRVNRVFFVMCLNGILWLLSACMCYIAVNKENLIFWFRVGSIGATFFWAVNLHFYIRLENLKLRAWQIALIYFPGLFIILPSFETLSIYSDFIHFNGQWKFIPASNSVFFYLFIFYNLSYTFLFEILLFRRSKRSKLRKIKLQSNLILISFIFISIAGCLTDFILPLFKFYKFPAIGPVFIFIYFIAIWYALLKYRFMIFQPPMVADEIISNIQDMVLLLDHELKLILVNKICKEQLFNNTDDYKGRYFNDFVLENADLKNKLNDIIKGEINNCNLKLFYKTQNESLAADVYFSRIVDKFGDFNGILLISKGNKGIKEFQNTYDLTARQMELIELRLSGLSNNKISDKLKISENTVESHFTSIYNKLTINNKIELFIIAKKFNMIS